MTARRLDFASINRAALAEYPNILFDWLPSGRMEGREYVCGNWSGGKGSSFKVNTQTGQWSDFAKPEQVGGDPVSLFAEINGLRQSDAARILSEQFGLTGATAARRPRTAQPGEPITVGAWPSAPEPSCVHSKHGEPSQVWCYRDGAGQVLHYVARYDNPDGSKEFCPWTLNGRKWISKGPKSPRPLYGLDRLAKIRGEARAIVCEGEKAADAAQRMCGKKPWLSPGLAAAMRLTRRIGLL